MSLRSPCMHTRPGRKPSMPATLPPRPRPRPGLRPGLRQTMAAGRSVWLAVGLALVTCVVVLSGEASGSTGDNVVSFVLMGATGNLAQKYLWQALFLAQVAMDADRTTHQTLRVIGAGRHPAETAEGKVQTILEKHISCAKAGPAIVDCEVKRRQFIDGVSYHQLKTADDFELLGKALDAVGGEGPKELGRIFYLSVPPFAYSSLAAKISNHCRPTEASGAFLRVAIEKPFGSDEASAVAMVNELAGALVEEELYRVDHYLGKRGVQQIPVFLRHNPDFVREWWTAERADAVEIVMKETEDAAGRTKFYDEYGVVRDVVQNHLTEIMGLLAMDPVAEGEPFDAGDVAARKASVIDQANPPRVEESLFGQYHTYLDHVRADHGKPDKTTNTPTFVATRLYTNHPRWQDVPFYVVAGKALDRREAYARVLFTSAFCGIDLESCADNEILFNIQGGEYGAATVIKGQLQVNTPPGWTKTSDSRGNTVLTPDSSVGDDVPYNHLIRALIHGQRSDFVSTEGLLGSWRLWKHLLHIPAANLRTYGPKGKGLRFFADPLEFVVHPHDHADLMAEGHHERDHADL